MSKLPGQPPPFTKHRQIFEALQRDISTGVYRPGDRLPSEAGLVKGFGASRITVGRALRELQQRGLVERRAGSGTYVKSGQAEGLSFGLLITDLDRTEIFEPICQGLANAPQAADHVLLRGQGPAADEVAGRQEHAWRLCQQYIRRRVSGVFFAPLELLPPEDPTNFRIIDALEKARIPVVLIDRDYLPYPQRSRHDLAGINNRRTGHLVTSHLLQPGVRRVAFVSYARSAATVDERMAGYREALYAAGLPFDPMLIGRIESDTPEAVQSLLRALNADAIVCANDPTAGRVMQELIAIGKLVPQDVRIAGIDDVHYAGLLSVPLTTMHQPWREIGMAAMSAMLERIARPDMPVRDILLECPLVIRRSCGTKAPVR